MVLRCRIQNQLCLWMPEFVTTLFIWRTVVCATWARCNVSCSSLWTYSCLSMMLFRLPSMHVSGPTTVQFSTQCTELYPKHGIYICMTSCTLMHNLFLLKKLCKQLKLRNVCSLTFCSSVLKTDCSDGRFSYVILLLMWNLSIYRLNYVYIPNIKSQFSCKFHTPNLNLNQ